MGAIIFKGNFMLRGQFAFVRGRAIFFGVIVWKGGGGQLSREQTYRVQLSVG